MILSLGTRAAVCPVLHRHSSCSSFWPIFAALGSDFNRVHGAQEGTKSFATLRPSRCVRIETTLLVRIRDLI